MAVCKRCGTVFDYNKWDGVCPKCCLYNRPEGSREEDDCWMENYNVDDNSYRYAYDHTDEGHKSKMGKNIYNQANNPGVRVNKTRKETTVQSQSVSSARPSNPVQQVPGRSVMQSGQGRNPAQKKKKNHGVAIAVMLIYIIMMILMFIGNR